MADFTLLNVPTIAYGPGDETTQPTVIFSFSDKYTGDAAAAQTLAQGVINAAANLAAAQSQITALQGQLDSANTALAAEKQKLTDLEAKIQADIAAVVP